MPAMIRVTRTEVGVLAQGSIVPRKLARRDALVQHATRQATRGYARPTRRRGDSVDSGAWFILGSRTHG